MNDMKENFDYKDDLKRRISNLKDWDGFPIGIDTDILSLSSPPKYTACPNPYINEFIESQGKKYNKETDDYHREPFVGDVSEGRNDPIYMSHTYATKVPYKAIQKYINHYTEKGDLVLDGFCGSGMTGVAAQSLDRVPILSDLSTIATYISKSLNNNEIDCVDFDRRISSLFNKVVDEYGWMYETKHTDNRTGSITYTVWSDVFLCPFCNQEYVFWKEGLDFIKNEVKERIKCTNCSAEFTKNECEKSTTKRFDPIIGKEVNIANQAPVLIKYNVGKKSFEKTPDEDDIEILKKIDEMDIPYWIPSDEIPIGFNTQQPIRSHGFTHIHHFFTKRTLIILSFVYQELNNDDLVLLTSLLNRASRTVKTLLSNYFSARKGKTIGGWAGTPLTGTLYIPSISTEVSIIEAIKNRKSSILKMQLEKKRIFKGNRYFISTGSVTSLPISNDSIDYIFTDPPFGDNKMYSELNLLSEAWLKVKTNNIPEAIVNKFQNKDELSYKGLMTKAFQEYYRVLKPKRWITVEFNNSKSSIWNLIQESMIKSGFVIAQVSILDKKQGSFKQVTSANSVKTDLVISAYKPNKDFEEEFLKNAGEGLEVDFIHEYLHQQPIKPLIERTAKMLYSKMLSYYIQHGYEVRYDAKGFYKMLSEYFTEEDGFWFNANQINSYLEYRKKMQLEGIDEIKQGSVMMFVTDEKSALVWLHNFIREPKSFSEIHSGFNQLANIQGDEVPDLKDLLEQNFVFERGLFRRPQSESENNLFIEKRENLLLRQFESLLIAAQTEKKKIKSVRKESVLLGFEYCYKEKRFQDIISIAKKMDKKLLEENAELKEFVDAAEISISGLG